MNVYFNFRISKIIITQFPDLIILIRTGEVDKEIHFDNNNIPYRNFSINLLVKNKSKKKKKLRWR